MAYTIHKKNEGHYHYFLVQASPEAVKETERKLRLSESVLRTLTVRLDEEMRRQKKMAKKAKPPRVRPVPAGTPAPAPESTTAAPANPAAATPVAPPPAE